MWSSLLFVLILQLVAAGLIPLQPSAKSVATWFQPDVNSRSACPKLNEDIKNAVALSTGLFSNGTACHSLIKIESLNGVTAYGRVTDLCPEPYCQAKDLNLSPKLFEKFAPLSDGVVSGLRWSFVNQTTSHSYESSDSFESDVVLEEKPEKFQP
ncbi:hypothetical protein CROQUDRAFT_577996 [Cronartium quercuum f. sp. fusiforme G11]|uniref:Uncharacterized protein n=1 Tax=Cronartium quercuum f. sp. fusiforme G11 TaxID=708437 RepID=A0A9P6NKN5_9BASI|nr:hypothetical protein CROQUDRAFT_577996 [Cronartium quercuum f. sp. fusiforme G11]